MSRSTWANAAMVTVAASAAMAVTAAPANAQFIGDIFAAHVVGSSLEISYVVTTDTAPISCKLTAKDLDQFGKVNISVRVYNGPSASYTTTTGPYKSGHHVRLDLLCRDRSGGSLAEFDTITIP